MRRMAENSFIVTCDVNLLKPMRGSVTVEQKITAVWEITVLL